MTVVFKPILERMAAGDVQQTCAQAVISVDKAEISWDGVCKYAGTIAIYSRNEVELAGTVTALHPAVFVKESRFNGNTTLHYELIPGKSLFLEEQYTDGILICYNGGEYVIPLHLKTAPDVTDIRSFKLKKEESASADIKKQHVVHTKAWELHHDECAARIQMAQLLLKRMTLQKKGEGQKEQEVLFEEIVSQVKKLLEIKPECIRYKLYEAFTVLEAGEVRYAAKLESRIRNIVISSKKQHAAEYCMLLYLQYRIAQEERQIREAGVRKQQLGGYILTALEQEPEDQDLIGLLCSECLDFANTAPMDLWETLIYLYQRGNSSPYLFFYGACLLQNPEVNRMLDAGMDAWTGRCLYEAAKRDMITQELAEQAAQCRPETYTPYICRMYQLLYDKYPSRTLLSALCKGMIRCDVRNAKSFVYYEQAVEQEIKIARLYDYYMHTLPSGYEKPVNREVLLYFALDEYINPQIYVRLCLNVLQFYSEDSQIYQEYTMNLQEFLKNQIIRRNWNEDLVFLAEKFLTADMLDKELAQALIPMLYLVQVKAEVPDGSQIIFESGIYKESQTGTFQNGKACLYVPGGNGQFQLKLHSGEILEDVSLKIRPLMQNEEMMHFCEILCPDDETLLLLKTYAYITRKDYENCDFQLCMQYLKDESLDIRFRKQLLEFVMETMQTYGYDTVAFQTICQCAEMMDKKQLASFTEILIRKGYYTEAVGFLSCISPALVRSKLLQELAEALVQYPENNSSLELIELLWYLLEKGLLNDSLIAFLAENYQGTEVQLRKLYQTCQEKGIPCPALSQRLLLRMLMKGEISQSDMDFMQELFISIVNLEQAELMAQAALNTICYCYICGWCQLEADVLAALQSIVIHTGSVEGLTVPCQLACLKYDQEAGLEHEIEHMILKQMCRYVLKKGMILDFVQRRAAEYGLSAFPVLQADLSECGDFSENIYMKVQASKKNVWAEYYVDGEKTRYRVELKQAYDFLYSAGIVMFAGETIHYRFHFENQVTDWKTISDWAYAVNPVISEKQREEILLDDENVLYEDAELQDKKVEEQEVCKISDRYRMLQDIAISLQNGESAADAMREYEKMMKLIEIIGKK